MYQPISLDFLPKSPLLTPLSPPEVYLIREKLLQQPGAGLFHASRMVLILGWRQRGLAFRCRFVYKGAWQMDSTRLSWSWARWKCGWRARTSADDGTISWRGTTTWGFGSSRAAGCVTSRCGAGTGWRCWAGNRERSSAHRGIAGWAGTGRCSSGACT